MKRAPTFRTRPLRTPLALRLMWRDMRAGRLTLLLLSLVLATGAATGIHIGVERFRDALFSESSVLLGADLRLQSAAPTPAQWLARARALGLETSRTVRFPSMLFAHGELALTAVKAAGPGYPLRGQLEVAPQPFAPGAVTRGLPGAGEAWLDSRLFPRLGIAVGDQVEIGDGRFRVAAALIRDPVPGDGTDLFAPRALIRLADAERTGAIKPGSRLRYGALLAGPRAARAQWRSEVAPQLTDGQRLDEVGPDQPALGFALARAERFLLLAGALAVLLSALAIGLAANRYADSQCDQVAILKSLGAGTRRIARMVLASGLTIFAAGAALGLALGFGLQAAALHWFADALPFALPPATLRPLLPGVLTALLCFAAFAWPPLARIVRVPPLRALRRDLQDSGPRWPGPLLGVLGAAALLWWFANSARLAAILLGIGGGLAALLGGVSWALLGRIGGIGSGAGGRLRLALASLRRDRLLNSVHALVFGAALMMALVLALLRTGLLEQWRVQLPAEAHNHFLLNIGPGERSGIAARLDTAGWPRAGLRPMTRGRLLLEPNAEDAADWDFMLSWSATPPTGSADRLSAGRWFRPGEIGVSVARGFAEDEGIALGQRLRFAVADREIEAPVLSLRTVDWARVEPNFIFIFSPETLADAPHTYMTSFHLPARDKAQLYPLLRAFPTVALLELDRLIERARGIVARSSLVVELMLGLVAAAGVLVLLAGVQSSMAARRRQAALLRALGAPGRLLLGALGLEFALLGALAGLLAGLGAEAVGAALQVQLFELQWQPRPWLLAISPLLGAAVVTPLGLLAGRRALRTSPLAVLHDS